MEIKKRKLPGRDLGTIYSKYILLCEKNLHAAILLNHFHSFSYWADQQSIGVNDDYHDPAIYNSLAGIAEWFLGVVEIEAAFDFLVSKEYIYYRFINNDTDTSRYERVMSITCDYCKVDTACETIASPKALIHTRQHSEEEARRYEEENKYYHSVNPNDLKEFPEEDESLEEKRKVRYHNGRAKKVNLPATLTLEQWILTLDYFKWKCAFCGGKYTILEHFVPLSHGKGTSADNCVPSCASCNNIKQAWNPLAAYGPDMKQMKEQLARVGEYLKTRA